MHEPVLVREVLLHLNLKPGQIVLDGTVGSGGHAALALEAIGSTGFLIGLDQDEAAIERTQARLASIGTNFVLRCSNFLYLDQILSSLNISSVHAVLLDVGISREQIEDCERGFSFLRDGPLDMRMDRKLNKTAADIVMQAPEGELASIFWKYGEERYARRVARAIVKHRSKVPIRTTRALAQLIEGLVPPKVRYGRIHPATRIFQALRIAVNNELNVLEEALPRALCVLNPGGKLTVISFHSLEDRIVKHFFIRSQKAGSGAVMTKKPVCPTIEEIEKNPMARSAKLRVLERKEN